MTMITGLLKSYAEGKAAVMELQNAGVPADKISLVINDGDEAYLVEKDNEIGKDMGTGAGIGAALGTVGGFLTGLGLMAIPGVGPIVAAGWLTTTLAGAATGAVVGAATGGLASALTSEGVSDEEAKFYADHVRKGGTLLCVKADSDHETQVRDIIARHETMDRVTVQRTYQERVMVK